MKGNTFEAIDGYGVSTRHRTAASAVRRLSYRELLLGRAKIRYKGKTLIVEKSPAGRLLIVDNRGNAFFEGRAVK